MVGDLGFHAEVLQVRRDCVLAQRPVALRNPAQSGMFESSNEQEGGRRQALPRSMAGSSGVGRTAIPR